MITSLVLNKYGVQFKSSFTKLFLFFTFLLSTFLLSNSSVLAVDSNGYWEKVGSLNTPRRSAGYVILNDGTVLIAGGFNKTIIHNSVEIYNPITKEWSFTGSMLTPRQVQVGPGMAKFSDGNVLIGGHEVGTFPIPSALTEIYDIKTNNWYAAAQLNYPRLYSTLLPLPNDKAISVGGSTGLANWSNITEIYDYASNNWKRTGNLNIARQQNLYALALSDGKVILVGGNSGSGQQESTSEIYDPKTGIWTLSEMPFKSDYSAITEMNDGRVFAAGALLWPNTMLADAAIYNPANNLWESIAPLPEPRAGAVAVLLDDDNILLVGGSNYNHYYTNTLMYNPNNNSWINGPELPSGFNGASYVKLTNGDYLFTAADEGTGGPGDSTYLFTNGNSTFLDVPYFNQNSNPWGSEIYDNADLIKLKSPTFKYWGCAVTSAAMILNYHNMTKFPDGTPINPGTLNTWLKNNNGYNIGGFGTNAYSKINWSILGTLTQILYNANKAEYKLQAIPFSAHNSLESDLELREIAGLSVGAPPIIKVKKLPSIPSHYVVPIGKSNSKISINDPALPYSDLSSYDNNNYSDIHRYIPSETDLSSLYFEINSNVEMLIIDANDNKSGKTILNQSTEEFNDIDNSVYVFEEPFSNPFSLEGESLGKGTNIFSLPLAPSGTFIIQLTSKDRTLYTLNASTFQQDGTHTHDKIEGVIEPGITKEIRINYSNNSQSEIEEQVDFEKLISDIKSLYILGGISNEKYYKLLLVEAQLSKRFNAYKFTKKTSKKLLIALKFSIERNKNRYLNEFSFKILNKDINFLIENN